MATLEFEQEAQDYNLWLSEDETKEALEVLPKEILDKINEFGDSAERSLADITSAIDNALQAAETAAGDVGEMASYLYSAESELEQVTSELGGL